MSPSSSRGRNFFFQPLPAALFLLGVAAIVIAAWTPLEPRPVPDVGGRAIENLEQFTAALQDAGATVTGAGAISQPFFSVEGRMLTVRAPGVDIDLQAYEYPSPSAAEAERETISPDGNIIGTTAISWIAPPHFFARGRLLILYLGDDQEVLSLLDSLLGPQIAGAKTPVDLE